MQIKDVAGIGLTSGRTVQQQGDLTVGNRLLGEIVIDDEDILSLVHEIFAHGRACIRRDIEHRGGLGRAGADHDGIIHRIVLAQLLHTACHRRLLLADGDIDADHVLALLVDNGVDGDRRLAGLTVADDQLTLAASDGDQGVDGLDTGLHRNRHRTARNHAGGRALNRPSLGGVDFTAAVDGIAEGIDHTADHLLAHRNFDDASAAADLIAFLQAGIVAQQHDADVVLLQVHHHAAQIPVEFNQLARHGIRYAGDAADAVGDADNGPLLVDRRFPVRLGKFFLQRIDERFVIVFQDIDRISDPLQHAL